MSRRSVVVRFLALALMAVWLGGFTFYSAVVIPVLHDVLKSPPVAGQITQRVTNTLNGLGACALLAWWASALLDRDARRRRKHVLLAVTTALLAALFALHLVMDQRLSSVGLRGFYPWHRAYLITSTVQWVVNLGLVWIEASRP